MLAWFNDLCPAAAAPLCMCLIRHQVARQAEVGGSGAAGVRLRILEMLGREPSVWRLVAAGLAEFTSPRSSAFERGGRRRSAGARPLEKSIACRDVKYPIVLSGNQDGANPAG